MGNVKFKFKTLDKDTRVEYPASDAFVEVSEAFTKRILERDPKGEQFEVEGHKYKADKGKSADTSQSDNSDSSELYHEALKVEYTELTGKKPGKLGAAKLKEAIDAHKLANPTDDDESDSDEDQESDDSNDVDPE